MYQVNDQFRDIFSEIFGDRSPLTSVFSKEIQAGSDEVKQRRVVCAANQNIKSKRIAIGIRHWDSLMRTSASCRFVPVRDADWVQGFIDQHGVFMSREEALQVALASGQRIYRCGGDETKLYSENLY